MHLPIYYINLDGRPDRRLFMEEQFTQKNITATRLAAVDKLSAASRVPIRWAGSATEFACTQSHVLAWRALLESAAPAAVILEDDAVLAGDFRDSISVAPYVGGRAPNIVKLEARNLRLVLGRRRYSLGRYAFHKLFTVTVGTCGYIISRAAAERSLSSIGDYQYPVDHFLFDQTGPHYLNTSVYQAVPGPCVPAELHEASSTEVARSDIDISRAAVEKRGLSAGEVAVRTVSRRLLQMREASLDPTAFFSRRFVGFADRLPGTSGRGT